MPTALQLRGAQSLQGWEHRGPHSAVGLAQLRPRSGVRSCGVWRSPSAALLADQLPAPLAPTIPGMQRDEKAPPSSGCPLHC